MSNIIPLAQNLMPRDTAFLDNLKNALKTPIKSKPYTAYITRSTPSVFLFLIDQSGSMDAKVTLSDGKTVSKAEFLSNAVNDTLNELLNRCIKGNEIRDYFEVAVIGYGGKSGSKANMAWEGALAGKSWVKMNELASHFLSESDIEIVRSVRGKDILSKVKRKKWITPQAEYQTPMNHAFGMATDLLEDWIVRYKGQNVYPPTVINITDGQFTDASNAEMLTSAQRIMDLKTMDGNVLLFNLHISTKATTEVIFPYKRDELPENDEFARVLFDMSSDLPDVFNLDIAKLRGIDSMQSFTGMAYNASLDKLVAMMNIGTSTTTRQIQQHA
jgi:hypothetical protein